MTNIGEYITAVQSKVREAGALPNFGLGDDNYKRFITTGLRRYSRDKPDVKVSDITGTSSHYIIVNASNFPNYVDGFSKINYIEICGVVIANNETPHYVDRDNWDYYRDSTILYVWLKHSKPGVTDTIRVQYTIEHTIDGLDGETVDSIPPYDYEAVIYWSASEALMALAGKYADSTSPTLRSDVVNYDNKSKNYMNLAKACRQSYIDWISEPNFPVSVTRNLDSGYGFGDAQPWQTHRSFS